MFWSRQVLILSDQVAMFNCFLGGHVNIITNSLSEIDYVCPSWQSIKHWKESLLTHTVQWQGLKIITGLSYCELLCALLDIELASTHLNHLTHAYFDQTTRPSDCLHRLLPPVWSQDTTCRLFSQYLLTYPMQNWELQSFIFHALANFQLWLSLSHHSVAYPNR